MQLSDKTKTVVCHIRKLHSLNLSELNGDHNLFPYLIMIFLVDCCRPPTMIRKC